MIKFFRRIRQNLLAENRLGKYFIYAIGEIILVVVGILIALQINNWNEGRKTHIQDMEFLNNLRNELLVDISALTDQISHYQSINNNIKNSIRLFDSDLQSLNPDEHREIVSALSRFQMLSPVEKNINRNDLLISQGTIDRIDKELNRRFLTYLQKLQGVNAAVTKLGETLQELEIHQIHPNVDYNRTNPLADRVGFDFKEIRYNRGVRNTLERSYGYHEGYIGDMSGIIEDAENLIDLIDTKLAGEESQ